MEERTEGEGDVLGGAGLGGVEDQSGGWEVSGIVGWAGGPW